MKKLRCMSCEIKKTEIRREEEEIKPEKEEDGRIPERFDAHTTNNAIMFVL